MRGSVGGGLVRVTSLFVWRDGEELRKKGERKKKGKAEIWKRYATKIGEIKE